MQLKVILLSKEYDECLAVNDLSFTIETGEITGFVGPNGAGKTTTMKIIASLEPCTSGDIRINIISILDNPELIRKYIAYVPDSLESDEKETVHDYLDFFARAYGYKSPIRQEKVKEIETLTNLTVIKNKYIDTLSKGMKQRVSIARALISDPVFILMDEPAAGLDPRARIELRDLLRKLREQGKGILISSHILSELSEICTSVVIIEKGRLLKSGKIEDVIAEATKNNKPIYQIKTIEKQNDKIINRISEDPMVSNINIVGNNIEFEYSGSEEQIAILINKLLSEGFHFASCGFKQVNLESAFMNITKGDVI